MMNIKNFVTKLWLLVKESFIRLLWTLGVLIFLFIPTVIMLCVVVMLDEEVGQEFVEILTYLFKYTFSNTESKAGEGAKRETSDSDSSSAGYKVSEVKQFKTIWETLFGPGIKHKSISECRSEFSSDSKVLIETTKPSTTETSIKDMWPKSCDNSSRTPSLASLTSLFSSNSKEVDQIESIELNSEVINKKSQAIYDELLSNISHLDTISKEYNKVKLFKDLEDRNEYINTFLAKKLSSQPVEIQDKVISHIAEWDYDEAFNSMFVENNTRDNLERRDSAISEWINNSVKGNRPFTSYSQKRGFTSSSRSQLPKKPWSNSYTLTGISNDPSFVCGENFSFNESTPNKGAVLEETWEGKILQDADFWNKRFMPCEAGVSYLIYVKCSNKKNILLMRKVKFMFISLEKKSFITQQILDIVKKELFCVVKRVEISVYKEEDVILNDHLYPLNNKIPKLSSMTKICSLEGLNISEIEKSTPKVFKHAKPFLMGELWLILYSNEIKILYRRVFLLSKKREHNLAVIKNLNSTMVSIVTKNIETKSLDLVTWQ